MATKVAFNPFTTRLDYVQEGGAGASQTLSLTGDTLSISGGNSVNLSSYTDAPQTLSLTGDTLAISGGNNVDLSGYVDEATIENITVIQNIIDGSGWSLPGPYTTEQNAASAGVAIGQAYFDNGGTVRVRQS